MSNVLQWLKDPSQGVKFDVSYSATPAATEPARVSGLTRPLLTVASDLSTYPEYMQCFVWAHEVAHIRERHLWVVLATAALCFPLLLVVRPYLEARADRAAAKWLTMGQFFASAAVFRRKGLVHRWLYGRSPMARTKRAGYRV